MFKSVVSRYFRFVFIPCSGRRTKIPIKINHLSNHLTFSLFFIKKDYFSLEEKRKKR